MKDPSAESEGFIASHIPMLMSAMIKFEPPANPSDSNPYRTEKAFHC